MTVSIIVPAFNLKPELAKRFEEDIAKVMHRMVAKEGHNMLFKEEAANLNRARTGATFGRQNNDTDELIIRVLRDREMTVSDLADFIGRQRDTVRMALDRLLARGHVRKIVGDRLNRWTAVTPPP